MCGHRFRASRDGLESLSRRDAQLAGGRIRRSVYATRAETLPARQLSMKAIVTGMIATYPVGGVAWDYGQYALGLERLGWDVYYLEDTGWEAYDPVKGVYGPDYGYGSKFLGESLARLSP